MRYFRISTFTGIEGHRNKPDKGTMRVVEGCMPHPVGGLRSGPVWTKLTGYKLSYPLHSGRTGTITAIVDYSETVAGTIKMTDAGHGLVTGWSIDVSGTDDYNGNCHRLQQFLRHQGLRRSRNRLVPMGGHPVPIRQLRGG